MVVKIRLFGVLRKFGNEGLLEIELPDEVTVQEAKEIIKLYLTNNYPIGFSPELVDKSAIANNEKVLLNSEMIKSGDFISLLPPVCGG